jgi:alpha-L-fucosidase 2
MAAILEMVVQSHNGTIRVLPAVPAEWPDGSAQGIRCRGGWSVDLVWEHGQLASMTVRGEHPDQRGTVRIRHGRNTVDLKLDAGEEVRLGPDLNEVGRTRA